MGRRASSGSGCDTGKQMVDDILGPTTYAVVAEVYSKLDDITAVSANLSDIGIVTANMAAIQAASDYATQIQGYVIAAATSADNAHTSELNAAASEQAAANHATAANTQAGAAATSATNAHTSEVNAAGSATSAANSATAATNNGAAQVTLATTQAGYAATSASQAAGSATAAATSATNAATSESNAATSKNAAATSATNAATSETNAANSASASATSASNAHTSEVNAAASAAQAQAIAGGNYELAITPGTTAQFWRGDKTWQSIASINANSATKLATPRNINGVAFDGTGDITINAVDSTPRVASSLIGVANGIVPLGSDTKIAAAFLPSYVDDVLEFANFAAFPGTGTSGVIYIADDTDKEYRWSGSAYREISASPGSTDAVVEGAVNLYFTSARAQTALTNATLSGGLTLTGGLVVNQVMTTGSLIARGGASAGSEGGQLILGYGGGVANTISGQVNNTWNIDVSSTNQLRLFNQRNDGSTINAIVIDEATGNATLKGITATSLTTTAGASFGQAISVVGNVTLGGNTYGSSVSQYFNAAAGQNRSIFYLSGGLGRWELKTDSTAESGSNAGSNFGINRYNDAGTYIDTVFSITRSTGDVLFTHNATVSGTLNGAAGSFSGSMTVTGLTNNGTLSNNGAININQSGNAGGANLTLIGNGATAPNKTIRAVSGNLEFVNSAYTAVIAAMTDNGSMVFGSIGSTGVSSATPISISLGSTYSNTNGVNPKLKIYELSTGTFAGLGASAGQLDYMVPGTWNHSFYVNAVRQFYIDGTAANFVNVVNFTGTGNQIVLKNSTSNDPSIIFRCDGLNFYILKSAANTTPSGTWDTTRPFAINLSTGYTTIGNGLTVNGQTTLTDQLNISGTNGGISFSDRGGTGTGFTMYNLSNWWRLWNTSGSDTFMVNNNGVLNMKDGVWHQSMEGKQRFYFATGSTSYWKSGGTDHAWRDYADATMMTLTSGNLSVTGNITSSSDRRLKKHIAYKVNYGLRDILDLRPATYRWKGQQNSKPKALGLIAQDVEEILPELVATDSVTGMKSVDYQKLSVVLIQAVKELTARVEKLERGTR